MKTTKLILGIMLSALVISCNKDDNNTSEMTEAKVNAKIDVATDDVSKIIDDQFDIQASDAGRLAEDAIPFLPSCATVTVTWTETTWTRTIDFHTEGCELPNGNVLRGQIIMTGSRDFTLPSHTINYNFVNFYHNDIFIEGNRNIVRSLASTSTLTEIHPVANMSLDITATLPDGRSFHRVGNRVREMIDGYMTPYIWSDNVFSISGSWTTTSSSGTRNSSITTALIARMNCGNIVSGVITTTKNSNTAVLDFGSGNCDNQATLTLNGNSTTITSGR
jgi:hypothetical protein